MPLGGAHAFYVLAEVVSHRAGALIEEVVGRGWERGLIEDAALAQSLAQADAFWRIRDDIDALAAALRPALFYDVSLPQAHMAGYVDGLAAALARASPDARLAVFGHVADGNLHLAIGTAGADHAAVDRLVYAPLEPLGGSISAEHGIGVEKRAYLRHSRSAAEIALMARMKAALDPRATLSPGKVLPGLE